MLAHGTGDLVLFGILKVQCLAPIPVVDSNLLKRLNEQNKVSQCDLEK